MVARSQTLGIPEAQIQIKVYCVMPKTSLETPCFGIVHTSVIYFGVCVCVCVCVGGGGGGGGGGDLTTFLKSKHDQLYVHIT